MKRIAIVALLGISGCFVVPPSRTTTTAVVELSGEGRRTGYRIASGAHSASWASGPDVGLDLGVGYIYERFDPEPADHGSYIELGAPVRRTQKRRLWLAGRGEVFWTARNETSPRRSFVARFSIDRFLGGGEGGSARGGSAFGFQGSGALEAFVELGVRSRAQQDVTGVVMFGVGFRAPLFGGGGGGGSFAGVR